MDLGYATDGASRRQRRQHATQHIVFQGRPPGLGARIAPTGDKDGEALADQITDQAGARGQIHDVVFVDPGRHQHHRDGVDRRGRRGVLDQLQEFVPHYHPTGRDRQILADLEGIRLHHPHLARRRLAQPMLQAID